MSWELSSWGRKDWGIVKSDSHLTSTLPTMRMLGKSVDSQSCRSLESTPRRAKGFCFLKQFQELPGLFQKYSGTLSAFSGKNPGSSGSCLP